MQKRPGVDSHQDAARYRYSRSESQSLLLYLSVHVRRMQSLVPGFDLEFHLLAFGKRFEAIHRDRREVNEDVFSAFLLDEAITFGVIEPLHFSLSHGAASGIRFHVRAYIESARKFVKHPQQSVS